jgi:hypothetical protein
MKKNKEDRVGEEKRMKERKSKYKSSANAYPMKFTKIFICKGFLTQFLNMEHHASNSF